jgi:DNA-directed RNA polymerase specialized sigma24 family protein
LQPTSLPSASLAEFYRFAVLLAGKARVAERVMAEVLGEVQTQMDQLRNESSRRAWLATHIRERCLAEKSDTQPAPRLVRGEGEGAEMPEALQIEAFLVAQRFHLLPEPERAALALFHLELFSTEEIGQILQLRAEQLAETIGRARTLLRESLRDMRGASSATP